MPSSYTDLGLELMVTGENSGTWGDKTNTNLELINKVLQDIRKYLLQGELKQLALAVTDGTVSNGRNAVIKFTGTITGNISVTIPDSIEKTYTIINGTTGAFTVEFKTVSGTGFTFAAADKGTRLAYADGTNVVDVNAAFTTISQFSLPTADGTNGQAIVTNGSGALSFGVVAISTGKAIAMAIVFG
jgi:hypothetical protein